ncbi:MAG: SDR family oxidoreductase [Alphaproteobacteria bacterium]|nr:SDR family oxidoreductase [Alphaproteobacteria bacterium]
MRLENSSTAVVTGAASGIGEALARALDARGVRLALCDVNEARLAEVAGSLRQTPLVRGVDVRDAEAVQAFADEVLSAYGAPDLVIANAGVALAGDFLSGAPADWDWIVDINFWGVVNTCRAFLPAMVERKRGWIANVSSIFGIIGVPNCTAYCATKAAVKGFTESLDQELRATGVGVSCIHPGGVSTRITKDGRVGSRMFGGLTKERSVRIIERGMPPEQAAGIILRGIERGQPRILVGRDAWFLDKLQRLAPVRYRDLVRLGSKAFR